MSYLEFLKPYQKDILEECLDKSRNNKNGGLSVPMGGGKTIISLILALETCGDGPILIVCSKTLIPNWTSEIKKFFGNSLTFVVFHGDFIDNLDRYIPPQGTKIVITTPQTTLKYFKAYHVKEKVIEKIIINEGKFNQHELLLYHHLTHVDPTDGVIYGTQWGCYIVDEFQTFMNIKTDTCRSIICIQADHKWALSGTLFDEPKIERIFAYYFFIDYPGFPNNNPEASKFLRSPDFPGVNQTLVIRQSIPFEITKNVETFVVAFNEAEYKIYTLLKNLLLQIIEVVLNKRYASNPKLQKSFANEILVVLIMLRQALISPIFPVRRLFEDSKNYEKPQEVRSLIQGIVDQIDVNYYINNPDNLISTRLSKAIEIANQHDKVIIFTDFRQSSIDILKNAFPGRNVQTLDSKMSIDERAFIIEKLSRAPEFIFLLTYKLGGTGLNLQFANTVILVDYTWNQSDTRQAIARVARQGQTQKINIYYIISNTHFENELFQKHFDKGVIKDELSTGPIQSHITTINMSKIFELLKEEENIEKLSKIQIK